MKRKSDDQKKLEGTYKKSRSRKLQRKPEWETIPDPQTFLTTEGAEIYYQSAFFLNKQGLLTDPLIRLVGIYAHEMDCYFKAIQQLDQEGYSEKVYSKEGRFLHYQINPLAKTANVHLRAATGLAKQLLIMPTDHDRLPGPAIEHEDPFANL